jgi:hypothetical protein
VSKNRVRFQGFCRIHHHRAIDGQLGGGGGGGADGERGRRKQRRRATKVSGTARQEEEDRRERIKRVVRPKKRKPNPPADASINKKQRHSSRHGEAVQPQGEHPVDGGRTGRHRVHLPGRRCVLSRARVLRQVRRVQLRDVLLLEMAGGRSNAKDRDDSPSHPSSYPFEIYFPQCATRRLFLLALNRVTHAVQIKNAYAGEHNVRRIIGWIHHGQET